MVLLSFTCIGCGETTTTIEGEWVLTKKVCADGTVLDEGDLKEYGHREVYIISEEGVQYTCALSGMKTTNLEMTMELTGENEYTFYAGGKFLFAVATLEGKQLSYTVGDAEDAMTFIFEKK